MQELWKQHLEWDEPLSIELVIGELGMLSPKRDGTRYSDYIAKELLSMSEL
jgi:hypothetical protein